MVAGFCTIADCKREAWRGLHLGVHVGCFCPEHMTSFGGSPEGFRAARAAVDQTNWRQVLIAALSDFRARVELELRNGSVA